VWHWAPHQREETLSSKVSLRQPQAQGSLLTGLSQSKLEVCIVNHPLLLLTAWLARIVVSLELLEPGMMCAEYRECGVSAVHLQQTLSGASVQGWLTDDGG
jgi:hypothetical protein